MPNSLGHIGLGDGCIATGSLGLLSQAVGKTEVDRCCSLQTHGLCHVQTIMETEDAESASQLLTVARDCVNSQTLAG